METMTIPLKLAIRETNSTFDSSGCDIGMYTEFGEDVFDSQLLINDCLLNETLSALYDAGVLHLTIAPSVLTTSELRLLLGKGVVDDFGAGSQCQMGINITDLPLWQKNSEPSVAENNYFILNAPLDIDIMCQNSTANSTVFE